MNWEAFGALSEFFGAIAVVASLLYLSRQLQMTRQVDQTGTLSSVVSGFTHHVGQFFSTDDDLALRGLKDREALNESERLRFDHLLSSVVSHGEMAHKAAGPGLVHDTDVDLLDWWLREKLFCYPGAREWLIDFEGWYEPSYLERLRRAAAAAERS
jgi:hypothetical protein